MLTHFVTVSISSYDFNTSTESEAGRHEAAIRCVEFCSQLGMNF